MSGGGKGGSTTSQVQIPAWLQNAAQQNLARADQVAQLRFSPYFGPDVAAMTPMQTAALQGTNQAALSFGLPGVADPMAGMPQAQTFAGGLQGYSSAPLYQQSVDALRAAMPGQVAAMDRMFINPITGAAPEYPFSMGGAAPAPVPGPQGFDWARSGGSSGGGGGGGLSMGTPVSRGGGTGSFGLPDPMSGGFAGTNLPGPTGNIINTVTRAMAPKPAPAPVIATSARPVSKPQTVTINTPAGPRTVAAGSNAAKASRR
jgi:hypothetical protein